MNRFWLISLMVLVPSISFCQQSHLTRLISAGDAFMAYVDGERLDWLPSKSLIVETVEFSVNHLIKDYDIDYGQAREQGVQSVIKDSAQKTIQFNGLATLIDFFDVHGWQFNQLITSPAFGREIEIIFMRKK